ncbi:hypothetical protein TL16_g12535 [Triparma laevis f. inornata]|uniref:Gamma-glutamylcyclotransferase n=1 Tax=Triparma laevis f. inornata TaxID=1714386 RepID=A0A9W7BR81_9STRA|nr:hypothetical protein TL16_g12535 [Triparma laevis f. inornata]
MTSTKPPVYIFGYGSLCWKPSPDLKDSVEICQGFLTDGVEPKMGQTILTGGDNNKMLQELPVPDPDEIYTRVWAQYSCDHRGTEQNYGVVCNLLKHSELKNYYATHGQPPATAFDYLGGNGVLGTLYLLPDEIREKALAELDVREKGGYERELVQAYKIDSEGGDLTAVTALLYRGQAFSDEVTRSRVGNFWARVLYDDWYVVAVMASSIGPSGWNGKYVFELAQWLGEMEDEKFEGMGWVPTDGVTRMISSRVAAFLEKWKREIAGVLFCYVLGNNENGQLGMGNNLEKPTRPFDDDKSDCVGGGLWESAVVCPGLGGAEPRASSLDSEEGVPIVNTNVLTLAAGGSHSGLIDKSGNAWLWGSNAEGQVGEISGDVNVGVKLDEENVVGLSLGHEHTLVLRTGGGIRCFGNNKFGQCDVPEEVQRGEVDSAAAGVRTSACILKDGRCFVWGQGQSRGFDVPQGSKKFVVVRCGFKNTWLLDDVGRVWGCGDNKRGQLGGLVVEEKKSEELVLILDSKGIVAIDCGWSHAVGWNAAGEMWGWGRADKGQLGCSTDSGGGGRGENL